MVLADAPVFGLDEIVVEGLVADPSTLAETTDPAPVWERAEAAALSRVAVARAYVAGIAARLLAAYPAQAAEWRSRARAVLLARPAWAAAFLGEVESGRIDPKDVPLDEVGRVALLRDAVLDARVSELKPRHEPRAPCIPRW